MMCSAEPASSPSASAGDDDPPSRGGDLAIDLLVETQDLQPALAGWLDVQLGRIAELAQVDAGQITLVIVDDDRMAELHGQYMDDPTTTDVLTFDLRDADDQPIEGDIVICLDEARRQARQRNHDTRLEVLLYAVHGLLHLLGEDDKDPQAFQRMHRREDELLTAAGFGAVFADRSGHDDD